MHDLRWGLGLDGEWGNRGAITREPGQRLLLWSQSCQPSSTPPPPPHAHHPKHSHVCPFPTSPHTSSGPSVRSVSSANLIIAKLTGEMQVTLTPVGRNENINGSRHTRTSERGGEEVNGGGALWAGAKCGGAHCAGAEALILPSHIGNSLPGAMMTEN